MTTGEIMLPRINHASTPPRISASPEIPARQNRGAFRPRCRINRACHCQTFRDIVQSDGQSQMPNPSSRLLLAVTKVAIPSGKLCRLMPRVSRMAVRLIDFGNGCTDFCIKSCGCACGNMRSRPK